MGYDNIVLQKISALHCFVNTIERLPLTRTKIIFNYLKSL
jgi:hypothetical protein